MDEPPADRLPGDRPPPGRRLERPPSDRYATPAAAATAGPADGSLLRTIILSSVAALLLGLLYFALAGPLAIDALLVPLSIVTGVVIGVAAKAGAGSTVSSGRRTREALGVTLAWFILVHVAIWLYARNEGGVLPLIDYLLQTFGPIVPLSGVAALLAAWWAAR
jgi:hypothetical protein